MRVLCLHPSSSSAHQLHTSFSSLEERLWTQHGIELVFVDAPLLDVIVRQQQQEEEVSRRRWYVEEWIDKKRLTLPPSSSSSSFVHSANDDNDNNNNNEETSSFASSSSSLPPTNNSNDDTKVLQYSGLDASLLHLTQIWSRGGTNNCNREFIEQSHLPFQGILGIQQGADVAAMLPLLLSSHKMVMAADNEEELEVEEEEMKENSMLEGLQFIVLVDGRDIINPIQQVDDDEEEEDVDEEEEDWYIGPNGIASLHVIAKSSSSSSSTTINQSQRNSELLAKRYGPNATIQYYNPITTTTTTTTTTKKMKKTNNNNNNSSQQQQQQQSYNHHHLTSPSLHNILGKYLVSQKNILHSHPQKYKLLQLQHQLSHVEQLASLLLTEEIKNNPPKCLMAMIGPSVTAAAAVVTTTTTTTAIEKEEKGENTIKTNNDNNKNDNDEEQGITPTITTNTNNNTIVKAATTKAAAAAVVVMDKTVGAWQGSGRIPGEQGGGAPCPEMFLLRQEERQQSMTRR